MHNSMLLIDANNQLLITNAMRCSYTLLQSAPALCNAAAALNASTPPPSTCCHMTRVSKVELDIGAWADAPASLNTH